MANTGRFYRIVLFIALYISLSSALCYFPDGTIVERDTPCGSTGNSTCCGQGFACLSNNFCAVTEYVNAGPEQSTYVRGSCTDETWSSGSCPSYCLNWDHGDNPSGGMGIAKCPYVQERFYCLNGYATSFTADEMCSNSSNFIAFADAASTVTVIGIASSTSTSSAMLVTSTSSISSSSSSSIGPTTSSTTTQSSPPSQPSVPTQDSSSNNNSIAIGAGIGAPLGVIAVSVALFLFYRHRRHQRLGPKLANQPDEFLPSAGHQATQDYKAKHGDAVQAHWGSFPPNDPQEMPAENFGPQELR